MVNVKLEKYAIFSHGFKGLPNGWHNLRTCNFLIGENSAGKSSFLQLIEIIDSRDHMVFLDICGIVEGIDSAFDVCSRATNASETTIGFLYKTHPEKNKDENTEASNTRIYGRLATYRKKQDSLQLIKLSVYTGDTVLQLKRTKNRIGYRIDKVSYNTSDTHLNSAIRFEKTHFAKAKRFTTESELDWNELPDTFVWIASLQTIITRLFEKNASDFMPGFPPLRCLHYAPIRGNSKRLYHGVKNEFNSTGEHFPFLLKSAITEEPEMLKAIKNFGIESGLFDEIITTSVTTKLKDRPFALQVSKSGSYYYIDELGFGIGQVLPIIVEIALSPNKYALLLQQPELHLHPKAQAALGDVFLTTAQAGRTLVIETHSDFIVDRYRLRHKQSESAPSSQIIFFDKDHSTGTNRACEIEMTSDGELLNIPDGYRDFFVNESLQQFENF